MFGRDEKKKTGEVIGFIGKGISIEGKLSFVEETVRIDGNYKGEISAGGTLVVGEGGSVEGQINVGHAIVTGEVRGVLEAKARVELKSPGKMFGEIRTPTLIIGDGVVFEGNCTMTGKNALTKAAETNFRQEEALEAGTKE